MNSSMLDKNHELFIFVGSSFMDAVHVKISLIIVISTSLRIRVEIN